MIEEIKKKLNSEITKLNKGMYFNLDEMDKDKEFAQYHRVEFLKCRYAKLELESILEFINNLESKGE